MEYHLSPSDKGRTIDLDLGDRLNLTLPETPTTGYRWSVTESMGLRLLVDRFEPGGSLPGAGGLRRFSWEVVAAAGTLALALEREWETPRVPIDDFSIRFA